MKKIYLALFICCLLILDCDAQNQNKILMDNEPGINARGFVIDNSRINLQDPKPLFSFISDGRMHFSSEATEVLKYRDSIGFKIGNDLDGLLSYDHSFENGWKAFLTLKNNSADTLIIENMVPFGESDDHIYITSTGSWDLARSKLFRPGSGAVGVILPDNAWELGYASLELTEGNSICALARRTGWENARRRRYKTEVYPGGSITWTLWAEPFEGEWQNGLKRMFQERWLYDLETFDNTLFEREDLQWIKGRYLLTLQMTWDHQYYDAITGKYKLDEFLETGKKLMGGYDVYSIWPTWPRLGVDQRNQWDLYEDLPGGLDKMKELVKMCHDDGTKFFIAYNPWDQSTRSENPYKGMARLIEATNADGVVLDTRGSSNLELQRTADSVRKGVVMYSEGMAIPKDMPGIIAGRVHDAIYMPPPLNLNKLIKPDFSIFRVCQLSQGRIHREAALSLFNGYGIELNTYYPGRPDWMWEEYLYLGKIVKVLRENSGAFNSYNWTPLLPCHKDSIWVNVFPVKNKTIYTI
nr:sulfatase-modifying factor protein [Bacteroidota bacterium]